MVTLWTGVDTDGKVASETSIAAAVDGFAIIMSWREQWADDSSHYFYLSFDPQVGIVSAPIEILATDTRIVRAIVVGVSPPVVVTAELHGTATYKVHMYRLDGGALVPHSTWGDTSIDGPASLNAQAASATELVVAYNVLTADNRHALQVKAVNTLGAPQDLSPSGTGFGVDGIYGNATSLAISASGEIFLGYAEGYMGSALVARYSGSTWTVLDGGMTPPLWVYQVALQVLRVNGRDILYRAVRTHGSYSSQSPNGVDVHSFSL